MARPRRTKGPQQNPRNMGLNRAASVRGNNRNLGQNQPFQGGLGSGASVTPGIQPPRAPRPGGQQGPAQCPVGQKPGKMPDGSMGCVPDRQGGAPGASPVRSPGAGTPNRTPRPPIKEGY